ncbi:Hypothetical predicted protein [Podarcis lilfordi]|uniref:Uncharacterized protein n=1 Tax=Podarcis lilfordi TaxID=74358 RepID=A0AA35P967_9SAUR|nr:Hypothetical predicted protein [Podarcis lilfordi]
MRRGGKQCDRPGRLPWPYGLCLICAIRRTEGGPWRGGERTPRQPRCCFGAGQTQTARRRVRTQGGVSEGLGACFQGEGYCD